MTTAKEYEQHYKRPGIIGKRNLVEGEDFTIRKCMCCKAEFKSAGIQNRMCDYCRTKTEVMI